MPKRTKVSSDEEFKQGLQLQAPRVISKKKKMPPALMAENSSSEESAKLQAEQDTRKRKSRQKKMTQNNKDGNKENNHQPGQGVPSTRLFLDVPSSEQAEIQSKKNNNKTNKKNDDQEVINLSSSEEEYSPPAKFPKRKKLVPARAAAANHSSSEEGEQDEKKSKVKKGKKKDSNDDKENGNGQTSSNIRVGFLDLNKTTTKEPNKKNQQVLPPSDDDDDADSEESGANHNNQRKKLRKRREKTPPLPYEEEEEEVSSADSERSNLDDGEENDQAWTPQSDEDSGRGRSAKRSVNKRPRRDRAPSRSSNDDSSEEEVLEKKQKRKIVKKPTPPKKSKKVSKNQKKEEEDDSDSANEPGPSTSKTTKSDNEDDEEASSSSDESESSESEEEDEEDEDDEEEYETDHDDDDHPHPPDDDESDEEEAELVAIPENMLDKPGDSQDAALFKWKTREIYKLDEIYKMRNGDKKTVVRKEPLRFAFLKKRIYDANEILPDITPENSVIYHLPKITKKYNKAMKKIEASTPANRRCWKCPTNFKSEGRSRFIDHYRHLHLDDSPFSCKMCGMGFSLQRRCIEHVKTAHMLETHKCDTCNRTFVSVKNLQRHTRTEHVPQFKKIYASPSIRKIVYRRQRKNDIKVKRGGRGGTFQLYVIIWRNKKGKKCGVSIGYTFMGDVCQSARHILYSLLATRGDRWVTGCSSRKKLVKGWYFKPEESFPLGIYAHGEIVASQLKWRIRKLLNAIHVLSTPESRTFLLQHEDALISKIATFLPRMPKVTRDYFEMKKAARENV